MLSTLKVCLAGPHHRQQHIPCQDACYELVEDNVVIAAVADGLGSERDSDLGAREAVRAAVLWCTMPGRLHGESAEALVRGGFQAAWDAVQSLAERCGLPLGQLDCTLCMAVFDGDTRSVAFGNAGDSGLAAAFKDGTYALLTAQDRDDEGRVYPLCFTDRWTFGRADDVASLLLCTDGVLEGIIAPPPLARAGMGPIDTRMARPFLHPKVGERGVPGLQDECAVYLQDFPVELLDDDKTVVCVFDPDRPPGEQPPAYYAGPDWEALSARTDEAIRRATETGRAATGGPRGGSLAPAAGGQQAGTPAMPATQAADAQVIDPQPADADADQLREAARDTAFLLGAGVITAAAAAAAAGIAVGRKVDAHRNAPRP